MARWTVRDLPAKARALGRALAAPEQRTAVLQRTACIAGAGAAVVGTSVLLAHAGLDASLAPASPHVWSADPSVAQSLETPVPKGGLPLCPADLQVAPKSNLARLGDGASAQSAMNSAALQLKQGVPSYGTVARLCEVYLDASAPAPEDSSLMIDQGVAARARLLLGRILHQELRYEGDERALQLGANDWYAHPFQDLQGVGPRAPKISQLYPQGAPSDYVGGEACLPTTVAMMERAEGIGRGESEAQLIEGAAAAAGTSYKDGSNPDMVPVAARSVGLTAETHMGPLDLDWVRQQLAQGNGVIILGNYYSLPAHRVPGANPFAGHVMLVTGWSAESDEFLVNDPFDLDVPPQSPEALQAFVEGYQGPYPGAITQTAVG